MNRFEPTPKVLARIGCVAIGMGLLAGPAVANDYTDTIGLFNGIAVFTIAKGGLMYEAAVAGQKFSFEAR